MCSWIAAIFYACLLNKVMSQFQKSLEIWHKEREGEVSGWLMVQHGRDIWRRKHEKDSWTSSCLKSHFVMSAVSFGWIKVWCDHTVSLNVYHESLYNSRFYLVKCRFILCVLAVHDIVAIKQKSILIRRREVEIRREVLPHMLWITCFEFRHHCVFFISYQHILEFLPSVW